MTDKRIRELTKAEKRLIDAVLDRLAEWRAQHGTEVEKRHSNARKNPNRRIAVEMLKAAQAVEKERAK